MADPDVLTQHNNSSRTGANLSETELTPDVLRSPEFGGFRKVFARWVDGEIIAQPLYVHKYLVELDRPPVSLVIVATSRNVIYAFDAESTDPDVHAPWEWRREIEPGVTNPGWQYSHIGPVFPMQTGIMGTPVIDRDKNRMYVAVKTTVVRRPEANPPNPPGVAKYQLYTLNLRTGEDVTGRPPAALEADLGLVGGGAFDPTLHQNRPGLLLHEGIVYVAFGAGSPEYSFPTTGWILAYDPESQAIIGSFRTVRPTTTHVDGQLRSGGGIWMAGNGPVPDDFGNICFMTGNALFVSRLFNRDGSEAKVDGKVILIPGSPPPARFQAAGAIVKLEPRSLNLRDDADVYFGDFPPVPWSRQQERDLDLGSGGLMKLPDGRLVGGGKEGMFHLMESERGGGLKLVQRFRATRSHWMDSQVPPVRYEHTTDSMQGLFPHIHGSPVRWTTFSLDDTLTGYRTLATGEFDYPRREHLVYVWGEKDFLRAYRYDDISHEFRSPTPSSTKPHSGPFAEIEPVGMSTFHAWYTADGVGMPGAHLSISANGMHDGIIWATLPLNADGGNNYYVPGIVYAFDATPTDDGQLELLWDSERSESDALESHAVFTPPTVANGRLFVATVLTSQMETFFDTDGKTPRQWRYSPNARGALVVYGLTSGLTSPPSHFP